MNKMIAWTVFFASASLFAEAPTSVKEQVENKQEAVSPKAKPPAPVKKTPKTKSLTVQTPVEAPKVKEEVSSLDASVVQAQAEQEALVIEALKVQDPVAAPVAVQEPAVQLAETTPPAAEVPAEEATPPVAEVPTEEAAPPVAEVPTEETKPAMAKPEVVEPTQTKVEESKSPTTSMDTKKEEKVGSSRFANIAIGTASAAVVIVAAILGSN